LYLGVFVIWFVLTIIHVAVRPLKTLTDTEANLVLVSFLLSLAGSLVSVGYYLRDFINLIFEV
jgi:hypothetical protein